jgi:hypothetical protein
MPQGPPQGLPGQYREFQGGWRQQQQQAAPFWAQKYDQH